QRFVWLGGTRGVLPSKALTAPLRSSGGASVLRSCVAMGLLLRVSYALDRARRRVALLRGEAAVATPAADEPAPARGRSRRAGTPRVEPAAEPAMREPALDMPAATSRGTSRLRQRVEPTLGRFA